MFIDLHIHTNKSPCSKITPKQLISSASLRGLDGVCITDHDILTIPPKHQSLKIFSGIEISSKEGHIIAYGVNEHIPSMRGADETIDLIHDQGGVAFAAHPYRKNPLNHHILDKHPWALGDRILDLSLDGIETLNGGCTKRENNIAKKSAKLLDLPQIGGSDAHSQENIGDVLTKVDFLDSIDILISELKQGRTMPLLFQQQSVMTAQPSIETHNAITIVFDLDNFKVISKRAGWNNYKPNLVTGMMSILINNFAKQNHASIIYGLDWERGTEEAYLILTNAEVDNVLHQLEDIRRTIEESGSPYGSTLSVGIAIHKPLPRIRKIENRRELRRLSNIIHAMKALKKSKKKGGNTITIL